MIENDVDVDLLFETSWEVCNKIGGIYTVLSTKAKNLQRLYRDKVIFIGPDVWSTDNPSPYFIESPSILKSWKHSLDLPDGLKVRVGRWDVPGRPIAILVKFESMYATKDEFYGRMWQLYGVDSLHAYGDYDEACAFSHAAGLVIESLYKHLKGREKKVIAHFDEWTTGMGLLYIKSQLPNVATIFTTHATSIGRSICGNGKPLYDYLQGYNGDQMAGELNMQSKHSLEKAAAQQADCFTIVSDITARECEQLLGRRPDVVTPNGFEPNFVPPKSRFQKCRQEARSTLLTIAKTLTGKNFNDDTFILATSGRCEYRNKGIDLYLDSLYRLKSLQSQRKVLAFIMVPAWYKDARKDLVDALQGKDSNGLADPYFTHTVNNPDADAILVNMRRLGLINASCRDNVTVVYVPCYLNGNDGVFNRNYYQLLIGMDATVFPSYYEPWGYTPLESVAFGVPTITTSLSGFGQWLLRNFNNDFEDSGAFVATRTDANYHDVVDQIARSINFLLQSDSAIADRISQQAKKTAAKADWAHFMTYYHKAFAIALQNELNRTAV